MKNKRGMGMWAYGMMLGLVIIILALALAPVGQEFVNNAMNASTSDMIGLDCSNASISNFDKGTCVITDFSVAYFFGGLIFIGGAVVAAKFFFGGVE